MKSTVNLHIPPISVIQLDIVFYSSAKQEQQWCSVWCGYLSKRNTGLTSTEKKFISALDIYLGQCVKKLSISISVVAENNWGKSYVNKNKNFINTVFVDVFRGVFFSSPPLSPESKACFLQFYLAKELKNGHAFVLA